MTGSVARPQKYRRQTWPGLLLALALVLGGMQWLAVPAGAQTEPDIGPKSVAPLAKRLTAAVVNISTSQKVKGEQGVPLPKVPEGSPFEEFFEDFFDEGGVPSQRKVSSLGSGFVIDGKEGLIVTNSHVISGAEEILVNFSDGNTLKVEKIIGHDDRSDLALLKVNPKKPLAEARFGSSEELQVGDWVMAIGNPFGLGGSVSVGIISAKSRDINSGVYDDYLQTDAAINKGNSGGPLFNMKGEVIGVNTSIISPTGGSIGIGFAVPSATAARVVQQLREFGTTRRGWLGVMVQSVNDEMAAATGLNEARGAFISIVTADSPAAKAGLKSGDVILSFNDKPIKDRRDLPRLVAEYEIGEEATIEVQRLNGKREKIDVEIGLLKEKQAKKPDDSSKKQDSKRKKAPEVKAEKTEILGLTVQELSSDIREKYKLADSMKGVVITDVSPISNAAAKGLKPGDIIVEAGQLEVTKPADIARGMEKMRTAGRTAILFRVENGAGSVRFVAVPLS